MKRILRAWSVASRGRYTVGPGGPTRQNLEFRPESVINAVTTVTKDFMVLLMYAGTGKDTARKGESGFMKCRNERNGHPVYRLRRLIPEECFAAMGMDENDCAKCRAVGVSDSALYSQAGNGIVTDCVSLIMQHLHKSVTNPSFVCGDEGNSPHSPTGK